MGTYLNLNIILPTTSDGVVGCFKNIHTMKNGKHQTYQGWDIYRNDDWGTGSTLTAYVYRRDNTISIGLYSNKEKGITKYFEGEVH